MTADQVAELMRMTLREALLLSAPILVVAGVSSLLISLVQTLTSIQDQTLSTVPRLADCLRSPSRGDAVVPSQAGLVHRFDSDRPSPVRELVPMTILPSEATGWAAAT